METKTFISEQFKVNLRDVLQGGLTATLTSVLTVIYTSVEAGNLSFDWKAIGTTALLTFLGYVLKNYLSASKVITTVSGANPKDVAKDIKKVV